MLREIDHGDVTELHCSTRASRLVRYTVSAFAFRGVLIDTAFPNVGDAVERWARDRRPAGVFLTHYHEDHAGNAARLSALGLPIALADATLARIRTPRPIGLYRRFCWGSAPALDNVIRPFISRSLQLVPTPGHSADHHVVWDAESGTVFGGDLFIGVKVRLAHPGEDLRGQVGVIRSIADLHPRRFFDAHRGLIPDPRTLLLAKADWMEEMIGSIEELHRRGRSDRAIRGELLGRRDPTDWVSAGDYSSLNFVRSVLGTAGVEGARSGASTVVPIQQ